MKGETHLNKTESFVRVHKQGKWLSGTILRLKWCPNGLLSSRYGLIVSKRVGGAVVRNLVKRRLREIMRSMEFRPGLDIVLVAKPQSADVSFEMLRSDAVKMLTQAGLVI